MVGILQWRRFVSFQFWDEAVSFAWTGCCATETRPETFLFNLLTDVGVDDLDQSRFLGMYPSTPPLDLTLNLPQTQGLLDPRGGEAHPQKPGLIRWFNVDSLFFADRWPKHFRYSEAICCRLHVQSCSKAQVNWSQVRVWPISVLGAPECLLTSFLPLTRQPWPKFVLSPRMHYLLP